MPILIVPADYSPGFSDFRREDDADETDTTLPNRGPYYVPNLDKSAQNIAVQLEEKQLRKLGAMVVEDYDDDAGSCSQHFEQMAAESRAFAGRTAQRSDGVANIHVPLITVGVCQFAARALEALVPTKGLVNIKATGAEDERRADRVSSHMNFQLQHQVDDFLQEMDVGLMEEGLHGSMFRKVYWDTRKSRVAITTIPASDVVLSYTYRGPIDQCRRITHVLRMTQDDIRRRVADSTFCQCGWDLGTASDTFPENAPREEAETVDGVSKSSTPREGDGHRTVLEQHCRLDLEGTGVQQPYIVTVDYESKQVLRITSREYVDEKGQPQEICYFIHYQFMPGPGFYGQGLGALLLGLQASADTLVNQLCDAGTYQNNPVHLVSERSNMPKGSIWNERGKMIPVDAMAASLKDAIFRIDFPPPSPVLLTLLEKVQDWGQRISSVTDLLQGLPQQTNQTATTTMTLAEQGLKLFSAVHKRTRASFTQELKLIYLLNRLYLSDEEYSRVLGESLPEYRQWREMRGVRAQVEPMVEAALQGNPQAIATVQQIPADQLKAILAVPDQPFSVALDYAGGVDIVPVADPEVASRAEKLTLAKEAFTVITSVPSSAQDPHAVREAASRMLEAMGIQDIDQILPPIPDAPPPENPQEVENAMMLAEHGSPVPADKPLAYHQDHLAVMDAFDREGFYKMLSPGGTKLFDQHRREHLAQEYLLTHQRNGVGNGATVPLPGSALSDQAGPGFSPDLGSIDASTLLPGPTGAAEIRDNAPSSLVGRFPGLATGPG